MHIHTYIFTTYIVLYLFLLLTYITIFFPLGSDLCKLFSFAIHKLILQLKRKFYFAFIPCYAFSKIYLQSMFILYEVK